MKKIIVIGGGFGGLSCLNTLCCRRKDFEATLIDKRSGSHFLPMLPDVFGRGLNPNHLVYPFGPLSERFRFNYIQEEVIEVNIAAKIVRTPSREFSYDYLVIACGSETNFYGNEEIRKAAFKLDDADDAKRICGTLCQDRFEHYIVSGAGYTGAEVVSSIALYWRKRKKDRKVILIERGPTILGPVADWMKQYTLDNLKRLGVECLTGAAIDQVSGGAVTLKDGRALKNAMLVWTAGVKVADFARKLNVQQNPQGRMSVDEFLRINDSCFVIGDAAYFARKGNFLRMAVQFSMSQGACAAENILRRDSGRPLKKYTTGDLGYIITMANNRSCGYVLNRKAKGILPTALHYYMCVYRSFGFGNKIGILTDLIQGRGCGS